MRTQKVNETGQWRSQGGEAKGGTKMWFAEAEVGEFASVEDLEVEDAATRLQKLKFGIP